MKRKFPKPRKKDLNQEEVKRFLATIDFEPYRIFQEWRHLLAFGKFQGKNSVFKLASTQKTSKYTKNEYNWNEAVNSISKNQRTNLIVPINYSKGSYGKLFYLIEEHFGNTSLIEGYSKDPTKLAPRIQQVAKVCLEIINLPINKQSEFAKSKSKNKKPIGERLLNSSTEWASQVPLELDKFLKIIDKNKTHLRTGIAHGDFVLRQLFDVNGKIGVIDGERASSEGVEYYDVAYFIQRVFSILENEKLGLEILSKLKDRSYDFEKLRTVLAARAIGGFLDRSFHEEPNYAFDLEFKNLVLDF